MHSIEGVTLRVRHGEVLGLVGESGSGKSTLARVILGLSPTTSGRVAVDGMEISQLRRAERKLLTRTAQLVFQDPHAAMDPRMTIAESLTAVLAQHGIGTKHQRVQAVSEALAEVGLDDGYLNRYPRECSGGQLQRVVIARALLLRPKLVICDEPTSALDASVQARILNLLHRLHREHQLTMVMISHDLRVVRFIGDRVAVMYLGQIVEVADREDLFRKSCHPYTLALLASAGESTLVGATTTHRADGGWTGWYTREPIGVVAAITPFNDPLNLVAHKLGPALVAGNAVVLKPAPQTPLTALALVELLLRNEVPAERLAVVPGENAGHSLVRDGAFGVAGQNCLSAQRVFIDAIRYGEILRRVVDAAEALVVGSKKDPATNIGPLVSETEAKRVERWIGEAVAAGAILHTGGRRRGTFVTPAVLTDVPADAALRNEEIFGPVVLLDPFSDLTAAINSANAVDTGLHAGVFTHDIRRAMTIANALTVGAVMINSSTDFRIDAMPFGGFKRSGIGREGIESAVEQLTEPKIVAINTGFAPE